ncbi:transcriptional regulator with XRE-family HTH domain [Lewinella aquimaris]|uniref:Transcriptional regulator with XRE-family HTH domain n=1 Tax=Neolewinella aquimaris TaxID=1835722 RepID=A0A840E601_9BACT|nr:helix-turn-helix transcriptional regulator [Neolewinella aquimaris]MBB4080611.1 transcriptional regulator with XRE-family HTH domain [Neolewinella aquimaris]
MNTKDSVLPPPARPGNLPNFIASNLRLLRKQAGWSQTELAEKVGLNRGNIASYESGCAEPSICKLLRISNLFDITTRDFTRRDFNDPTELALARSTHHDERNDRRERFASYRERCNELGGLIDSSHHLFEYKRATLDKPCKEAEIYSAQYLQLLELSNQLMKEHRNLLDELGRQCS